MRECGAPAPRRCCIAEAFTFYMIGKDMKLPPDFERTLKTMSDDDLCTMLASYEEYLPEAIELARAELQKRKLPVQEMLDAAASLRRRQKRNQSHPAISKPT